jgi:hypothetical protein
MNGVRDRPIMNLMLGINSRMVFPWAMNKKMPVTVAWKQLRSTISTRANRDHAWRTAGPSESIFASTPIPSPYLGVLRSASHHSSHQKCSKALLQPGRDHGTASPCPSGPRFSTELRDSLRWRPSLPVPMEIPAYPMCSSRRRMNRCHGRYSNRYASFTSSDGEMETANEDKAHLATIAFLFF